MEATVGSEADWVWNQRHNNETNTRKSRRKKTRDERKYLSWMSRYRKAAVFWSSFFITRSRAECMAYVSVHTQKTQWNSSYHAWIGNCEWSANRQFETCLRWGGSVLRIQRLWCVLKWRPSYRNSRSLRSYRYFIPPHHVACVCVCETVWPIGLTALVQIYQENTLQEKRKKMNKFISVPCEQCANYIWSINKFVV